MADHTVFQNVCTQIDTGFSVLSNDSRQFLKSLVEKAMRDAYERGQEKSIQDGEMIVPVNLTIQQRHDLSQPNFHAAAAIQLALNILRQITPVQLNYPDEDSYILARLQFSRRIGALNTVRQQLDEIGNKIGF
jgi:hypothetical protein